MSRKCKKWFKYTFFTILGVLLILVLLYAELIVYALRQGYGQMRILWNSQPIEQVLAQNTLPDSLKAKLRLVQAIRQFAFDSLGLRKVDNYTTFFDQQNQPILWVVTACEPFDFKPKEWNYAFLGNMSYKGFFNLQEAQALYQELKTQGYDVDIDEVAGWSTLGWFKDPVLSNMLKRSEGSLANLIIHELSHSTIYVKNDVTLNENIADFIGDKGAELFLKQHFGKHSPQYQNYQKAKQDSEQFYQFFLQATQRLQQLYKNFSLAMPFAKKKAKKDSLIRQIVSEFTRLPFQQPKRFTKMFEKELPNNAFFMHFVRYRSKQRDFETEFQQKFNGNLRAYIQFLRNKYPPFGEWFK